MKGSLLKAIQKYCLTFFNLVTHLSFKDVTSGGDQTHFGIVDYRLWVLLCIFWACTKYYT